MIHIRTDQAEQICVDERQGLGTQRSSDRISEGLADTPDMAINVAGTNAIGDYLASEILNIRTLMGDAPQQSTVSPISGLAVTASTTPQAANSANLRAQLLAQNAANTETLFGFQNGGEGGPINELPPIPGETSQQLEVVAIQSSLISSEFSNISTLFGSLGLGTQTNTLA